MSILQDVLSQGIRADQPVATDVSPGTLYFVTDEGVIEQSDGATWSAYSGTGNGDVEGPGSSVAHSLAAFADTSGKVLEDAGVLTADVVTKTDTQTLTNKTLTAPILTGVIPLEAATSGHPALKASSTTLQARLGDDSGYAPIDVAGAKFNGTYYSPLVDDGNSSTALTIDLATGNEHKFTLTGNVTLTLSNPVAGGRYVIQILTGAGGFTVAWPGTVLWPGGTAPVITVGASAIDLITLFYDGTNFFGAFAQDFS